MQATAQMLETRNFVDVRFQDKPRYLQPAGIYWLEALAVAASGTLDKREVWAYRLPTLLAMTASIGITAWLGAALFGPNCGLLAGLLLIASVLVTAEGRMATIDSTLLLVVLTAQALMLGVLKDYLARRPTSRVRIVGFWLTVGCGLMLKGPVILIPVFGTLAAFTLSGKDRGWLRRFHFGWGWLVMLAVVLPWCVSIAYVSHGEFFSRAVGRNFLGKIGHGQEAHGAPPGFHLLVFLLAFWPGSLFAVMALPVVWAKRRLWQVRYLLSWIIPHWIIFELIATKLPHYVLPTYPAIAILTAFALTEYPFELRRKWRGWKRYLLDAYAVLYVTVSIALGIAGIAVSLYFSARIPPVSWVCLPLTLSALGAAVWFFWKNEIRRSALWMMSVALLTYVGLFCGVIPQLHAIWLSPRLADMVEKNRRCSQQTVVSSSFSEPSFVFLMHGQVVLDTAEAAAKILDRNRTCGIALVSDRDFPRFAAEMNRYAVPVMKYDQLRGFNYSTGKWLDIGLYAVPMSAP